MFPLFKMSMFCDGESSDPATYHNRFAPNNQNTRCSGRSAWEIMRQHSDFKSKLFSFSVRLDHKQNIQIELCISI